MILKLLRPVLLCLGLVLPSSQPIDEADKQLSIESCQKQLELVADKFKQDLEDRFGEGFLEDLANGNIEVIDEY